MNFEERLRRINEFDGNLVMGSRLFNKATKRDTHLERVSLQKKSFIDPATNKLKEDLFIPRTCPLCGADNADTLFIKDGFAHVRCTTCDMVYVNCLLKPDALNSLYKKEDTYSKILSNDIQKRLDDLKFSYFLDLIEDNLPQRDSILDIGCGPGYFLSLARQRGWTVTGCEFNHLSIHVLEKEGIRVIDRPIENSDIPPESFQCVTLFTVLEHIPDPKNLLMQIHRILIKGGIIGILVPNILEETGFEIIECETVLTNIDLINNYLNYENPFFGTGQPVLSFLTPEFIHRNLMGYLLFVIARAK
jgi:SAM-dependent methyltransferase